MLEYHPRNHYVNDFTIIRRGEWYHLFHIPGQRLKIVKDIRLWALKPSAPSEFTIDDPKSETMNSIVF